MPGFTPDFYGATPHVVQVDLRKIYVRDWKLTQTLDELVRGEVSQSWDHPLHLKSIGKGRYYVIDGSHRVVEALRRGMKSLPARIGHPAVIEGATVRIADAIQKERQKGLSAGASRPNDNDTKRLVDALERDTGARITLLRSGDDLTLHLIAVPKVSRGEGVGTRIMQALVDHADERGMRMRLTPALRDAKWGTTSRTRLVKFYKRFGFVENKGRHKDFTIGAAEMYREPKGTSAGRAPSLFTRGALARAVRGRSA